MATNNSINTIISDTQVSAFGELLTAQYTPQALIHFPYNLNTDIVNTTVTGSGSATHDDNFAVAASGASTSSSGMIQSNRVLEYSPGMGALCRFTCVYGTGTADNTQIVGVGNGTDGFFFGYNGTAFGILHRNESSDTWIAQSSWNVDVMDGTGPSGMTLDPSKGNVFQIRYQWLGFGKIQFYLENDSTGNWVLVHKIDYTNRNTDVSLHNPTLPFCVASENGINNSNVETKVASLGLFTEGITSKISYTRNALDNEKTIGAGTETNILTIRNKSTYQSISNKIQIQPDFVTIASEGNKNFTFRMYVNATLGGSPSYTDVSTNTSVVDYDTAGTTVSGGTLVATLALAKSGQQSITFSEYDFVLSPGTTMTFAAESSQAGDATVGVSWAERFT